MIDFPRRIGDDIGSMVYGRADSSWTDVGLVADVVFRNLGRTGVRVGRASTVNDSYYSLRLDSSTQTISLVRGFVSGEDTLLVEPFDVREGRIYRLGSERAEGRYRGSVTHPVIWQEPGEEIKWISLLVVTTRFGERLAVIAGDQPHYLESDGTDLRSVDRAEAAASEVRSWVVVGQENPWSGICIPTASQIRLRAVDGAFVPDWQFGIKLGTGAGPAPGEFIFPISFAGSPDGRVYVLDAGNTRIQVFDLAGNHITQFGSKGSGAGEFDFGTGGAPKDFAGSVVVDEEGFINVADVGNKRIQKFAP